LWLILCALWLASPLQPFQRSFSELDVSQTFKLADGWSTAVHGVISALRPLCWWHFDREFAKSFSKKVAKNFHENFYAWNLSAIHLYILPKGWPITSVWHYSQIYNKLEKESLQRG